MTALSRALILATALLGASSAVPSPTQKVIAPTAERIETNAKHSNKLRGSDEIDLILQTPTDFHPDTFYKAHTSTKESIACHRKSGAAGVYGAETSDCDSPISLVNATFDWIADNLQDQLDFVIWTGDSARHDSDEKIPRTKSQVIGTNKLLAHKFAETFVHGMKIPVIPTFGNNDILPHNILLPGPNNWLDTFTKIWKKFIPEVQRHSFDHGGWFYVEVIPQKLAVFSLNTLYFFDRNAGIDDCTRHSEPGFQQMEWLRIHLDMFRENGMKAIFMGHVPPARTDSKQNWDETCWQKYTLWLRQYRDVIVGAVYGHMNIDHFMLQDTKEINFKKMTVDWAKTHAIEKRSHQASWEDEEFGIASASDYLHELRTHWAKLPNLVSKLPALEVEDDDEVELDEEYDYDEDEDLEAESSKKKKKDGKKGKKKKKKNPLEKLGGKWAERYQLSMIGPSIVPNYFPTIRVIEYNITGLEDHVTWADALDNPDLFSDAGAADLFNLNDEEEDILELDAGGYETESKKKKKKKKKKKGGKKKKQKPNFEVPDAPSKSSPPGPAYSPQPLTFTGYTQYYANLTWLNNDMTEKDEAHVGPERWREGMHEGKSPKHNKPNPRDFEFEVEYSTFDDERYKLKDLTVKNMVHLAYRIGKNKKKSKKGKSKAINEAEWMDGGDFEVELGEWDDEDEDWDDDEEEEDSDDESESEDDESEDDEVETDKKKGKKKGGKDKKKKKKKQHKKHAKNKVWMEFLRRAFVSTIPRDELKKYAVDEGGVYIVGDVEEQEQVVLDEL
ncbi:calcineurin-like phosphoesterase [Zalerion maritima]|uniref:Endopolyphosphatase n=1 Tax=Zalerion maritima TaxID=339359 RepID=A0AAD5WVT2_9PEZI|nr:calcineurin-like phosphoesterase [Zalerion maritima]